MRGQISIEYMAVVGIAMIMALSILAISNYYSQQVEETVEISQLDRVAKEIVNTAESVYYFGEPSKATLEVYLPDGIKEIDVGPNEISFKYRTKAGITDIFKLSDVKIQGEIPAVYGYHKINIESRGTYVWINST